MDRCQADVVRWSIPGRRRWTGMDGVEFKIKVSEFWEGWMLCRTVPCATAAPRLQAQLLQKHTLDAALPLLTLSGGYASRVATREVAPRPL